MIQFYENIIWNVDFKKYLDVLTKNGIPSKSSNNLIIPTTIAYQFVPEFLNLNRLLIDKQYKLIGISLVRTRAGVFGGIHVDKTRTKRNLELRLNIPLENGGAMLNRWYDISSTPYSTIDWDYEPNFLTEGDRWFYDNRDTMVSNHCIGTLTLDSPSFFNSSVPHNVDGSQSTVDRKILSMIFSNSRTDRIADWCERDVILECINKI